MPGEVSGIAWAGLPWGSLDSNLQLSRDLPHSPPQVDRTWGIWGSFCKLSKAIFYLLKGEYTSVEATTEKHGLGNGFVVPGKISWQFRSHCKFPHVVFVQNTYPQNGHWLGPPVSGIVFPMSLLYKDLQNNNNSHANHQKGSPPP